MSENRDGSSDTLFALTAIAERAGSRVEKTFRGGAAGQNSPETPRPDGKFTPDALSDIRSHVDRNSSVAWWPEWPSWASTEQRDEWDDQELADREVPCALCGAERREACHGVVEVSGRARIALRVAHVARHKAREDLAKLDDESADEHYLVDLTEDGRAYLAELRARCEASERCQRIGEGLSPLVVDGGEVES